MKNLRDPDGWTYDADYHNLTVEDMVKHLNREGVTVIFDLGSVRLHRITYKKSARSTKATLKKIWRPTLIECVEAFINSEWEEE